MDALTRELRECERLLAASSRTTSDLRRENDLIKSGRPSPRRPAMPEGALRSLPSSLPPGGGAAGRRTAAISPVPLTPPDLAARLTTPERSAAAAASAADALPSVAALGLNAVAVVAHERATTAVDDAILVEAAASASALSVPTAPALPPRAPAAAPAQPPLPSGSLAVENARLSARVLELETQNQRLPMLVESSRLMRTSTVSRRRAVRLIQR